MLMNVLQHKLVLSYHACLKLVLVSNFHQNRQSQRDSLRWLKSHSWLHNIFLMIYKS